MAAISERRMLIPALLAITMPVAARAKAVPVQDPIAARVGWKGLGGGRGRARAGAGGRSGVLSNLAEWVFGCGRRSSRFSFRYNPGHYHAAGDDEAFSP